MSDNNDNKDNVQDEKIIPVEEYVNELKAQREKAVSPDMKSEEKPDYLLPQFKNIEEQAKSYKELQALQTKQAQELAQYKKDAQSKLPDNAKRLAMLEKMAELEKQKINNIYKNELDNLSMALKMGKISEFEAMKCLSQLKDFTNQKLQNLDNQIKSINSQTPDLLSPKEFFKEDVKTRNYMAPICEFLENTYHKMSKKELEDVKNLVNNLENSLREEILNENQLSKENETYRNSLTSTTNLNPQSLTEKIYTMDEIKQMKPEEFRKNQRAILEQFVSHKLK